VDAEAPAHAEIAIEGKILPNESEREGPFGETSDHSHVIEVTAITSREDDGCGNEFQKAQRTALG
jgi:2,5-furandicarboxylate decarboxylase 1